MSKQTSFWCLLGASALNAWCGLAGFSRNLDWAFFNTIMAGICLGLAINQIVTHGKKLFCFRHRWDVMEVYGPNKNGKSPDAAKIMKCERCGERINL